ncbi:thioredoxin H1-like [Mercurialis annua]|uniref:thioredoxin H1-like n=1 Tax=Mercurialis annua TaxID=3986 RepID=UPI00215EC09A|nr:thioredoxin H1-like [Mercurialis annua]
MNIRRKRNTLLEDFQNLKEEKKMAEQEGQVIACHTIEAWTEQLNKAQDTGKLVVVDFTATWCGPCKFIAPIFAEMAKKLPHITFLKVDVDELKTVAQDWDVDAMPTFAFLRGGKIVDRVVGAQKAELEKTILLHDTPSVIISGANTPGAISSAQVESK